METLTSESKCLCEIWGDQNGGMSSASDSFLFICENHWILMLMERFSHKYESPPCTCVTLVISLALIFWQILSQQTWVPLALESIQVTQGSSVLWVPLCFSSLTLLQIYLWYLQIHSICVHEAGQSRPAAEAHSVFHISLAHHCSEVLAASLLLPCQSQTAAYAADTCHSEIVLSHLYELGRSPQSLSQEYCSRKGICADRKFMYREVEFLCRQHDISQPVTK